jgi:sulfite exporter TauE/SafE
MMEPLSFITALFLGLFGSSHCLLMCGGISAALSTQVARETGTSVTLSTLAFNLGRITSYGLAGLLVATLGLWLQGINDVLLQVMRTLAAVLLILMGLYIARWATWLTRLEQLGQSLWRHIQPLTTGLIHQGSLAKRYQLGLLWGWLPCGLVYSTLSWAATSGQPLQGAAIMMVFGLGTLPALFASSLAAGSLMQLLNHQWSRTIAGVLLICFGIWTAMSVWWPSHHLST